jgi:putative hydrolase of the HAD superfamily
VRVKSVPRLLPTLNPDPATSARSSRKNHSMDFILFDLDNTLYSAEQELFSLIDQRINRYMRDVVGIPHGEVDELRRSYWRRYGVTMRGLMHHHGVDPEDYLAFVHDVDIAGLLRPDPALRRALEILPQRRMVFTNSTIAHSERVLHALGINDMFEKIFDIRVADYLPKPYPEPYHAVLSLLGAPAERCIMVEDSPENLKTAKELGMGTILVGGKPPEPFVDVAIPSAVDVPGVLALWNVA